MEQIPVAEAPGFAPFPLLGPPHILLGTPPTDRFFVQGCLLCQTTDDAAERQRKLVAQGRSGALAYSELPLGPFAKTLAKIAHSYVVSQVGLTAFRPLLPAVILGEVDHPSHYVGGGIKEIPLIVPDPPSDSLHQICPMTLTIKTTDYIATQIRLFAHLRPLPPVYLVIVGEYQGRKGTPHPVIR